MHLRQPWGAYRVYPAGQTGLAIVQDVGAGQTGLAIVQDVGHQVEPRHLGADLGTQHRGHHEHRYAGPRQGSHAAMGSHAAVGTGVESSVNDSAIVCTISLPERV